MKNQLFFLLLFMCISIFLAIAEENTKEEKGIHIISKNIDVTYLQGTFYELASNTISKIGPGFACKCTQYEFSEIKKEGGKTYIDLTFSCDRNLIFKTENSKLFFQFQLNIPMKENTTVVEEFSAQLYLVKNDKTYLINKNLSILYAEGAGSTYKYLVIGGSTVFDPLLIISRQRTITKTEYKRLLDLLVHAGYDPNFTSWPFLIQTDQNFCD